MLTFHIEHLYGHTLLRNQKAWSYQPWGTCLPITTGPSPGHSPSLLSPPPVLPSPTSQGILHQALTTGISLERIGSVRLPPCSKLWSCSSTTECLSLRAYSPHSQPGFWLPPQSRFFSLVFKALWNGKIDNEEMNEQDYGRAMKELNRPVWEIVIVSHLGLESCGMASQRRWPLSWDLGGQASCLMNGPRGSLRFPGVVGSKMNPVLPISLSQSIPLATRLGCSSHQSWIYFPIPWIWTSLVTCFGQQNAKTILSPLGHLGWKSVDPMYVSLFWTLLFHWFYMSILCKLTAPWWLRFYSKCWDQVG